MAQTRKIRKKDWDSIALFISNELNHRKNSEYRKSHEKIWKEVDRQLKMEPMKRFTATGQEVLPTWNSAFELGELSKASEIISADVMRILFPDRGWFEGHVELEDEDEDTQNKVDALLKSFMAQQHNDFGFELAVEVSVKEALHHGSYVCEVLWDQEMEVQDGSRVRPIAAPTWVPHSMWNSYPDMSPRIIGTSMFYRGSMILVSYMPMYKLKEQTGEGWMQAQFKNVPESKPGKGRTKKKESEIKDVELITYYGDIVINRADGDIYLPNSKAITANGVIVFWRANELPYPSIIFGGYEKQDIRDPYYNSPLIKQSPMQKLASVLANKFVDGVALKTEPPVTYDGNDPYMVANDGPVIAPGAKTASKSTNAFQQIEIGDPTFALNGLQMALREMQSGTGVSEVRQAVSTSDRQTATEIHKIAQAGEVRTVDFIRKLSRNLQTFLYMQHNLNVKYLKQYTFYNDELNSRDFVRVTRSNMQQAKVAHFEVTGAKGILGEEQRMQRMGAVTAFASSDPGFAPLLERPKLLLEAYKDAGVKNPERFVKSGEEDTVPAAEVEAIVQQATVPLQEELQKQQEALAKSQMAEQAKIIEAQTKAQAEAVKAQQEEQKILLQHERETEKIRLAHEAEMQKIRFQAGIQDREAALKAASAESDRENNQASEKAMAKVAEAIAKLKPPVVNIHQGGKKKITLPGGREATVEEG